MKLQILSFLVVLILFAGKANAQLIGIDPALTGLINANGLALKTITNDGNKRIRGINKRQKLTGLNLDSLQVSREQTYSSLSKVISFLEETGEFQDLLKSAKNVISNTKRCIKMIKNHPMESTLTSAFTPFISEIVSDATDLSLSVQNLFKKGGKNNLLNSVDRMEILRNAQYKLNNINNKLNIFYYQICVYKLIDTPQRMSFDDLQKKVASHCELSFQNAKRNIESMSF